MNTKEKYDLICSLGANCSAAHQLRYRGLRKFALPFDWTAMKEDECLYKLSEGFENNFEKFLLKENLIKLDNDEYSQAHKDRIQYKDKYTEIYYYNHFNKELNDNYEYEKVRQKFNKRIKRLINLINSSNRILFIFSSNNKFSLDAIYFLVDTLIKLYPNKEINIRVQLFNQEKEENFIYKNSEIFYYKRSENLYDYTKTNYEWSFLDNVENNISNKQEKNNFLQINKIKKGFSFILFPKTNTITYIKLYFLGLRVHFSIGKYKEKE